MKSLRSFLPTATDAALCRAYGTGMDAILLPFSTDAALCRAYGTGMDAILLPLLPTLRCAVPTARGGRGRDGHKLN